MWAGLGQGRGFVGAGARPGAGLFGGGAYTWAGPRPGGGAYPGAASQDVGAGRKSWGCTRTGEAGMGPSLTLLAGVLPAVPDRSPAGAPRRSPSSSSRSTDRSTSPRRPAAGRPRPWSSMHTCPARAHGSGRGGSGLAPRSALGAEQRAVGARGGQHLALPARPPPHRGLCSDGAGELRKGPAAGCREPSGGGTRSPQGQRQKQVQAPRPPAQQVQLPSGLRYVLLPPCSGGGALRVRASGCDGRHQGWNCVSFPFFRKSFLGKSII